MTTSAEIQLYSETTMPLDFASHQEPISEYASPGAVHLVRSRHLSNHIWVLGSSALNNPPALLLLVLLVECFH